MDDDPSHMKDGFKRIAKRALQAEMVQPLGDDKPAAVGKNTGNSRNGISHKTIIADDDGDGDDGDVEIDTPRDRDGSFEPPFMGKHPRKIDSFSDEMIERYGHGMRLRDMQSD